MKIFGFVKNVFFAGSIILSSFINTISLSTAPLDTIRLNANKLSCISMSNQPRKARPGIFDVSTNNSVFYPFSFKTSNCSGKKYVFLML